MKPIFTATLVLYTLISQAQFSGSGSGTAADPYQVTNATELNEVRNDLTAHYQLMNDLDLTTATGDPSGDFWNDGAGWAPIAVSPDKFTGLLDGNSYTITGLHIDRSTEDKIGLFGLTGDGSYTDTVIVNLTLASVDITGQSTTGSLVGTNTGVVINCHSSGTVTGTGTVGGLVGSNSVGKIYSSSSSVIVTATGIYVGGLTGNNQGYITNCKATGNVSTSSDYAGGISGYNSNHIIRSFAAGDVSAEDIAGGITAGNSNTIENCYSTGTTSATNYYAGGLVGLNTNTSDITNCFAIGTVTAGQGDAGGLVGSVTGTMTNSYWNTETTGQATSVEGTGKTTAEMTFEFSAGVYTDWDFDTVWGINATDNSGYPFLKWEGYTNILFEGGDGSVGDPFQITNAYQLDNMRNLPDSAFILLNDIDLSTLTGDKTGYFWNDGSGWEPMDFEGSLDGQNYTISGLYINRPDSNRVGLFGSLTSPNIENLTLDEVNVTGNTLTGALFGITSSGNFSNVHINGEINGNDYVGLMGGRADYSSIDTCSVSGNITGKRIAGGLLGYYQSTGQTMIDSTSVTATVTCENDLCGGFIGVSLATIQNSYFDGTVVAGTSEIGGFIGRSNGNISTCYATGSVEGALYVGGFVGDQIGGVIENCYTAIHVQSDNVGAGLVAKSQNATIRYCYAASQVLGGNAAGLVFNANNTTVQSSYYDALIMPSSTGFGISTTRPDMLTPFAWDNTTIWTIDEGVTYPYLQWQAIAADHNYPPPTPDDSNLEELTGQCSIAQPTAPTATDSDDQTVTATTESTFPLTEAGGDTIIWKYEDSRGNYTLQYQETSIEDTTDPEPDNATLSDVTAQCEVTAVTAPTATDNCDGQISATTTASFPITTQGTTTITWTYEDAAGNTSSQTQNVVIDDTTAPVSDQSTLPQLSDQCAVSMPDAPTATDECTGTITATTEMTFPITSQGDTTIVWVFDDGNGNTSTVEQAVSISDFTVPVLDSETLTVLTGECSVDMPTPPTATDNCSGSITGTTDTSFPITTQGSTTVIWTFTDDNGMTTTQSQTVTVEDQTDPVPDEATLPDLTFECTSVATITAPTATDNCAGSITGTSSLTLPITEAGNYDIIWSYEDNGGNIVTQMQNVTVGDGYSMTVDTAICMGETYTFPDGTEGTTATTQESRLTSSMGCDSVITTTLTILDLPEVSLGADTVWACDGEVLTFALESTEGIDSYEIQYFDASSEDSSLEFEFDELRDGFKVIATGYNASGCSSSDTVLLKNNAILNMNQGIPTIANDPNITFNIAFMPDNVDRWYWDFGDGTEVENEETPTHSYTSNGSFQACLIAINECDSIASCVTLEITNACVLEPVITNTNGTLTAGPDGNNYQWIDCDSGEDIPGQNLQSFTPTETGNYAVEVSSATVGGCVVVSACEEVVIEILGTEMNEVTAEVFPNPAHEKVIIKSSDPIIEVDILNISGISILKQKVFDEGLSTEIVIEELASGIYFTVIKTDSQTIMKRLIIR